MRQEILLHKLATKFDVLTHKMSAEDRAQAMDNLDRHLSERGLTEYGTARRDRINNFRSDTILNPLLPDYLNLLPRLPDPDKIKTLDGLMLALTIPGDRAWE